MVEISEVTEEDPQPTTTTVNAAAARAEERLSDADEIDAVMSHITRPSARLHLENLITKLRKEGKALQRVAASKKASADSSSDGDLDAMESGETEASAASPAPAPPSVDIPKRTPAKPFVNTSNKYQSFPTYMFDAGKYNSPTVSVYVPLDGIGQHDKSKISCEFTSSSFDLIVSDYEGKDYRLLNTNLEKDVDTTKCKYIVKPNKIIIKLGKVKGEYGFDSWTQLTAKKAKSTSTKKDKENPAAGIMDMMKDMYEEGDDNMKKMIGETMYKQRMGQLNSDEMTL